MNYSELQAAIASWMNRDDLTDVIPGFIDLCEAEVNRQLRTADQENELIIVPADGQIEALIPPGYEGFRAVRVDQILRYKTPHALDTPPPYSDRVRYYTLIDNKIRFNQTLTSEQQIELLNYAQVPALTDFDVSNWLLQAHEDVYLFGSLRYAERYVKNPANAEQMQSVFIDKLGQVIERDKRDRWSGDTLQMKSNRPRGVGRRPGRRL